MAQHQDLKRKGGADPDHQMSRNHSPPPPLSIEVPKIRDLPNKSNPWSDVQLPVGSTVQYLILPIMFDYKWDQW